MKHCGTQRLETDRLILRRFVIEDAAAMYQNWASDDEVTKYLTWPTHTNLEVSQSVIKDWINSYAEETFYQWAIVLKELGEKPIGSISVVDRKEKDFYSARWLLYWQNMVASRRYVRSAKSGDGFSV